MFKFNPYYFAEGRQCPIDCIKEIVTICIVIQI